MKLTESEMINILDNKNLDKCTQDEKAQVMRFAFGEEFMSSHDKGSKKTYEELDMIETISEMVNEMTDEVFTDIHQFYSSKSGDITPEQTVRLERIKKELTQLYFEQLKQNL